MRQLGQLQSRADEFARQNAEVIVVFREEREEVQGLLKIKKLTKTDFTLLSDLGSRATAAYSGGEGNFDSYVIDSSGVIRAAIDGTLTQRATAGALLEALQKINGR